ncbi:hypothetical protein ACFPRL_34935 [Pseudoclavibacter helvolus]
MRRAGRQAATSHRSGEGNQADAHTPCAAIGKGSGVQRGEQLSCELRDLAHGLS